nr:reverse transcriptase domain-containing protein [Tanacetum cinerariifolium]
MADNRTMEELLQAPTEGYREAIVIPKINADHFEIKTNLLQLVQANMYHGFKRENPHTHINNFKRNTSTLKFRDVPNDVIKLMMFPYSLREMLEFVKAVEESCITCGRAHAYYNCPNTDSNQPSVCAATGTYNQVAPQNRASNYMAPPCFAPVQNGQNRFNQNQGQENNFNWGNNFQPFQVPNQGFQNQPFQVPNNLVQQGFSNKFSNYKKVNDQMMRNMQNQINSLKGEFKNEIKNTMKTQQIVLMEQQNAFQNNLQNMLSVFFQNQASTSGTLPSNTILNPKGEMKVITTRSGSTAHIQLPVTPIPEPNVPKTLPRPNIPYPSRLNDQKLLEKATNQMEKFFQIFQDLHFDISFADALILMPKFASTVKRLLTNKDKFFELAKILLNENCSAMLLKKLPEKLGDPGKFFIPCDFLGMDVCHALADLGASINLMPLSIWKKLSLPKLIPTRMTLELVDRSITRSKGVAEDVFIKEILLEDRRALIDVYGEEITLQVNDEAITFNLNQTTRYSSTYDDLSVNQIDIICVAREEYAREILGFSNNFLGGNPTLTFEPILSDSSLSFTSFEGSDFILEEIEAYLKDESISSEIDHVDCDPEGDICLIEKLLNDDPFRLPLMDLKQGEVVKAKSLIEEPPELELKDLPSHLEYAYLEGVDKLPVIITKDLKVDEKEALLKVLKSHKRVIAWKITDIKGIDPRLCTHKILMEEDYKPAVQSQRRVNPKIHDVIKKEVIKLLDARMIYPILTARGNEMPQNVIKVCEIFDVWGIDFMGPFPSLRGNGYILVAVDYLSNWVEAKALPINDARVVVNFLKSLFTRFRTPKAILSDRGTHFCNDKFAKVMSKYGVTRHLSTAYYPQISGQVEVSNQVLKRILERMVGENHASWSETLDDALWALKHVNFDLKTTGDHRKLQLNELNDLRDQAYENYLIYKEKTKKIHDSKINNRIFNVGDRVLLFNSRLKIFSGKLKTRWSGPFTIIKVFPYGTVELSQPDGPNFKVNGHRVKHYFGGDVPQLVVSDIQTFPMDK